MTTERIDIVINETGGRTVKRSLDDIAESAQRGGQSLNSLNGGLGGTSQASAILTTSLKALGVALGALRLTSLISEASRLSQRYNELGIVLGVVGRNAGLTKSEVDATTEAVRKQGISMIESRQIVTRMIQSQIDLSKATQLARLAQDAAVIGQINSSEALDRLVFGITSAQVEVLRGIGINVSFEQSYSKLAKEMGVTQNALTEQQKLQARLNVVLDEAAKLNGVYAGSMENAGKQMRSTQRIVEDLKVKIGGLFDDASRIGVTAYTDLLKDLDAIIDDMAKSGELKDWSHRIGVEFAGLADMSRVFVGQLSILFKMISAGFGQIKDGNFQGLTSTFMSADAALKALYADGEKYVDQVNARVIAESMLTEKVTGQRNALNENKKAIDGAIDATDSLTKSKKKAGEAYDIEIYKLKEYEKEIAGMREIEHRALKQHEADLSKADQITQSVATKQEIYNQTLEELTRLKPHLSIETYNRALQKAQDELNDVSRTSKRGVDDISQMWIQAGRNIQTSLGNLVFDFFNGGLDDMVKNAGNAVLRIMSEFAGLRIAQTIGLTSLFTAGTAAASTGAAAGGGVSALNVASLGSSALNLFKGGFGATSLLSGVGSYLPGSAGAFFSGMGGGTVAGVSSSAAMMGSTFASVAGPAIALAAVDAIGRALAGDKKLGGAEYIPVIGGFLAAMFGRGPLKQKETTLEGILGLEGFESGSLETHFQAKGGWFRSNKNDYATVDAVTGEITTDNSKLNDFANNLAKQGQQIFALFNDTAKQTSTALFQIGDDLGLSTDALKDFSYEINLVSEKGKALTEEQIGEEIQKITDAMATSLLPEVDQLAKSGESALQTVTRLGAEYTTLVSAATLLLGKSPTDARALVSGASFDARTGFVDAAGGVDALNQKASFFASNFLSGEEQLNIQRTGLNEELTKLGLSTDLTREQFKGLVQSFGSVDGVTEETMQSLLNLQGAFDAVRDAEEATAALIKNERLGLENQLLQAQGDTAEIRRRELEALDPSNRALAEQIYLLQDQAAEQISLNQIADERLSLEDNLLRLQGNAAEIRARELAEVDESNRSLLEQIYLLEDQAAEQDRLIDITNERMGLEDQLLQLQGDTNEIRARELAALDESNRGLLEQIYLLQDQAAEQDRLNQINDERLGLEDQLLQLMGDTAEIRRRELAAIDESNRSILENIYLLEDQAAKQDRLNQINDERLGLEDQLLNLQGDTAEIRARELAAIDESNRSILEQIFLLEDQAAEQERLNQITDERLGLEDRLLQLQGDTEEIRTRELAALDESNRTLLEQIFLLEDQAAEQERLNQIADERLGLENQLLQMQGNTAEIRARELAALDESNRAILESIYLLEDQAAEQDRLNQINDERLGLEDRLLQLQGDTAEIRRRELESVDESNRSILEHIYLLEDQAAEQERLNQANEDYLAGLEETGDKLNELLGNAFSALQRAIDEERTGVLEQIDSITKSTGKLRDLSDALSGAIDNMSISGTESEQRAAAQYQLSSALSVAKLTGVLPDAESLSNALSIVTKPSEELYGDYVSYMRDFAATAAVINELNAITVGQISDQEMALELANDQLTALDGIGLAAQAQLDALNGIDTTLLSITDALNNFADAVLAVQDQNQLINQFLPSNDFVVVPASYSDEQRNQVIDVTEIVEELRKLQQEMVNVTKNTKQTATLLDDVSAGGTAFLVENA